MESTKELKSTIKSLKEELTTKDQQISELKNELQKLQGSTIFGAGGEEIKKYIQNMIDESIKHLRMSASWRGENLSELSLIYKNKKLSIKK